MTLIDRLSKLDGPDDVATQVQRTQGLHTERFSGRVTKNYIWQDKTGKVFREAISALLRAKEASKL